MARNVKVGMFNHEANINTVEDSVIVFKEGGISVEEKEKAKRTEKKEGRVSKLRIPGLVRKYLVLRRESNLKRQGKTNPNYQIIRK